MAAQSRDHELYFTAREAQFVVPASVRRIWRANPSSTGTMRRKWRPSHNICKMTLHSPIPPLSGCYGTAALGNAEQTRAQGMALLQQGRTPTAGARALGVSRVTVYHWKARGTGQRALSRPAGRKLKLTPGHRRRLERLLERGPSPGDTPPRCERGSGSPGRSGTSSGSATIRRPSRTCWARGAGRGRSPPAGPRSGTRRRSAAGFARSARGERGGGPAGHDGPFRRCERFFAGAAGPPDLGPPGADPAA